jgi:hypothetical protein
MPSAVQSRWIVGAGFALCAAAGMSGCSGGSSGETIIEPVVTGTIALTLLPGSATVAAGGTGSVGLSISRGGGFAGPVTLSVSGVPAGVSLTFGSNPVSTGTFSTSVNISVAAGTAASSGAVVITGTGSGAAVTSVTFALRTN